MTEWQFSPGSSAWEYNASPAVRMARPSTHSRPSIEQHPADRVLGHVPRAPKRRHRTLLRKGGCQRSTYLWPATRRSRGDDIDWKPVERVAGNEPETFLRSGPDRGDESSGVARVHFVTRSIRIAWTGIFCRNPFEPECDMVARCRFIFSVSESVTIHAAAGCYGQRPALLLWR